ncbi:hypothetical protein BHMPCIPO_06443 [Ensifer sesbaniae]|nr:hypothetical protein [Ensifer sesbaniae]
MSLAEILDENLAHVLDGTGAEDPQGEPIECRWNSLGHASGSSVLVDSEWKLSGYDKGLSMSSSPQAEQKSVGPSALRS